MTTCSKEKNVFMWARDITKDLITLYEAQPVLYVTKLKEYKNKNKRMEAVLFMKNELIKKYPIQCKYITEEDVLKKIHVVRTQYLKEVNTMKKFLSSGATADVYIPNLWCFDMLGFLAEGDPVRQGESNLELTENDETEKFRDEGDVIFDGTIEELSNISNTLIDTPSTSRTSTPECTVRTISNKRKSNNPAATLINTAVKSLEEYGKKRKEENEFDIFGRTVAVEMRKIENKNVLRELKKSIFTQIIDSQ